MLLKRTWQMTALTLTLLTLTLTGSAWADGLRNGFDDGFGPRFAPTPRCNVPQPHPLGPKILSQ